MAHTSIIPGQTPRESTMRKHSKLHPICLNGHSRKNTTHKGTDYLSHIHPKKDTIAVELISNHINCETTGKFLGYRDMVKMDASVWTNSMCNELIRLYQGSGNHARKDTIEFIIHKEKPKDIKSTYVRAVCDIRPQKIETHRTRLPTGVNLIYYPGDVITSTLYLNTMKLHFKSAI